MKRSAMKAFEAVTDLVEHEALKGLDIGRDFTASSFTVEYPDFEISICACAGVRYTLTTLDNTRFFVSLEALIAAARDRGLL